MMFIATDIVIRENKNREMFILNKFRKFSTQEYFHLYSIVLILLIPQFW